MMQYGVAVPNFGKFAIRENILEFGLTAEKLGFDSLWVSDHVVVPKGHKGFGNVFYDPVVTLSCLSSATLRIKLGTSVLVLPYRNPIVLAKQLSTLDVLSKGRLIVGIGAGWLEEEFDALGSDFGNRGSVTDESITVIKELISGEGADFQGNYFSYSDIEFYPKTFNSRLPEILVGGNSINAMKRAVKYGSGWHAVGCTPDEISDKVKILNTLISDQTTKFSVSVRKNIQLTNRNVGDRSEVLRGDIQKVEEGISAYKEAGVDLLVFQILGNSFKKILKTMEDIKNVL